MPPSFVDVDALTEYVTDKVESNLRAKYELIPKNAERWVSVPEFCKYLREDLNQKKRPDWVRNEFFDRYPEFVDQYVLINDGPVRRHYSIEIYGAKKWIARHCDQIDWRG